MTDDALRRTVRRCTAILAAILGFGMNGTTGFDGRLIVLGALAYLVVSAFLGYARRYDERIAVDDGDEGSEAADGEASA